MTTENIHYFEYRAINELRQAHQTESGENLIAFIVFGDLIETGDSYDIHVLEIVRDWSGSRFHTFVTSASLYLRGTLFLNFMTPEEFENAAAVPSKPRSTGDLAPLLEQLRKAYVVMYEKDEGYVARTLGGSQLSESIESDKTNPLSLRELASVG